MLDRWRPDLVVHEMAEMAAPLVCTARGLPYVDVSYGPLIPADLLRAAGRGAAQHWLARGLQPDPFAGLLRYLYVDICPPGLQNAELASVPTVQHLRPVVAEPAGPLPDESSALPDRPLIYLTLGTVYNRDLSVFATVLEGLRDEPVTVVVTVGRNNDPAAFGPQPPNVAVHRYIPQAALLPHCSAAVIHGGAGTMLGALAAGLPLLGVCRREPTSTAMPIMWSRPARDSSSSARTSRPRRSEPRSRPCWTSPATGSAARRIAGEIAAMPTPVEGARRDHAARRRLPRTPGRPQRRVEVALDGRADVRDDDVPRHRGEGGELQH